MANDIEVIFSGQEAIDVTVDLSTISGSLRIFNSDESFDQTITEDTELSDIIVGDSLTSPSNVNVAVDTWDKLVSVAGGIGYNYPFATGQEEIYLTGDDAWVETNIFTAAVRLANGLKPKNWLAVGSFTTLINNNAFGNLNRFTDTLGGQSYANSIIVDNYTGLSWIELNTGQNWNTSIDDALALSNDYDDWFLPDRNKIQSIHNNQATGSGYDYAPFNTVFSPNVNIWTSSTKGNNSANAYRLLVGTGAGGGNLDNIAKTTTATMTAWACRKHF